MIRQARRTCRDPSGFVVICRDVSRSGAIRREPPGWGRGNAGGEAYHAHF